MKLFGKNPVLERLKANPGSIKELHLRQKTDLSEIVIAAKKAGIAFVSVSPESFSKLEDNANTQGVVAIVDEYKHIPFQDMLSKALSEDLVPVFVDGVTDPQNLGSIIRNLACLGGFTLVIPEHNSACVNETVLRVASGGENHILISQVANTVKGITDAKKKGFYVVGAITENSRNLMDAKLSSPMAVVVGSEGKGIRPGILKELDAGLSLPMEGAKLSYNVAVATALFCYEINRGRSFRKEGREDGKQKYT